MNRTKKSLILTTLLLSPMIFNMACAAEIKSTVEIKPTADVKPATAEVKPIEVPLAADVQFPVNKQLISAYGDVVRDGNKLTLTWTGMQSEGPVSIEWRDIASNKIGNVTGAINAGALTIDDPNPSRRTIFTLIGANNQKIHLAERKVPASGMDNFRDMGGYKTAAGKVTKWGLIYRSDTFYKLKPEGYKYFSDMNMGYVFDLRNSLEVSKKPDPSVDGITYYHTQIPDQPPKYKDVSWETTESKQKFVSSPLAYSFYVDTNAYMVNEPKSIQTMKDVFQTALTAKGKGLVWHCAGGKDRTGFVSAVFLAALGVPQETIVNDYLLTNEYRKEFDKQELADVSKEFKGDPKSVAGFLAIQQSRPEYIQAGLNKINQEYGSIDNYLQKAVGLDNEQIKQLQTMYTE